MVIMTLKKIRFGFIFNMLECAKLQLFFFLITKIERFSYTFCNFVAD